VISANIDGIDRALNYGFFAWLTWQNADVICLQELNTPTIPDSLKQWLHKAGYEVAAATPKSGRKGGGVAILSKSGFDEIKTYGDTLLAERGQMISAKIRNMHVASVYITYGNSAPERAAFGRHFAAMKSAGDRALICGDFNIIGSRRDSHLWYAANNKGYRDEERAWLGELLAEWKDTLRLGVNASQGALYTWWSNKGRCYLENRGTRLDYQLASPNLVDAIVPGTARVVRELQEGKRMTDHAPIVVEYDV
jgi:exodeoxyribonuclease-3